jgi:multiple sugar transport system substrate-binding protein
MNSSDQSDKKEANAPTGDQPRAKMSRRSFIKSAGAAAGALAVFQFVGGSPVMARPPRQDTIPLRAITIGGPPRAETFEAVVAEFRENNPNVDLEWVPVPVIEWNDYLTKVATIIAGGQQIDMIEVGTEGLQLFASRGISRPLDEYVLDDADTMSEYFGDVNPVFVETMMYEGSLYNLPWLWAGVGIFYNKNLFNQAGVDFPTDDWTVEDFQEAARAIGALGDDVFGYIWPNRHWGGFIAWSFANDANILEQAQFEGGDWMWDRFYPDVENRAARGGGFYWPRSTANDPNNVEALQMLQDLAYVDDVSFAAPIPDMLAAFTNDQAGMIPSHRAWVATFNNAGLTPDDFDVALMPRWKRQKTQFGCGGLTIATLSPNPDVAWSLLQHMIRPSTMDAYVRGGVHTSPRRSVANDPAQHEDIGPDNWQAFYNMVDVLDAAPIPSPPENREFDSIMTGNIGLAMANEMPAQDALDKMHEELTALLGA